MEQVIQYFQEIDPVLAALYATLFTWGLTAAGAALVFFFKGMKEIRHCRFIFIPHIGCEVLYFPWPRIVVF